MDFIKENMMKDDYMLIMGYHAGCSSSIFFKGATGA